MGPYEIIKKNMNDMTASHKKIAEAVLSNHNQIPFLTVKKLAHLASVSEATIVRFTYKLGYSGYQEFQDEIRKVHERKLTTIDRLKMSSKLQGDNERLLYQIFDNDKRNLEKTIRQLNFSDFDKSIEMILSAKKIYVVASRSAISLGTFLQYYLYMLLGNVEFIGNADIMADKMHSLGKGDVLIGISFKRYTRSTVKILEFAKKRGAAIIAITDDLNSPLIEYSDISLRAISDLPSFIDSFIAPLSIINAIITIIGKRKEKELSKKLEGLEELWEENDIFI